MSSPQFQNNSWRRSFVITKECVEQLMEENAAFLKALTEKNKIIKLSGLELQRRRLRAEKYSKQTRLLARANTQTQTELTMFKDKVQTLEHELKRTTLVLQFKNAQLDEKRKLIKKLKKKLKAEEEKLIQNFDEGGSIERDHLNHMETANDDIARFSSRKRLHIKIKVPHYDSLKESDEMATTEDDHNKSDQVAHYDSLTSNPVNDDLSCASSKAALGGKSLHGVSLKRKAESSTYEAQKPNDYFHDYEFQADLETTGPLNETVQRAEIDRVKRPRIRFKCLPEIECKENLNEAIDKKIQARAPNMKSYMEIPSVIIDSTQAQEMQKGERSSLEQCASI